MSHCKLPSFEEATDNLRSFLANQGFQTDLVWICREAVFIRWSKLYIKVPLQNESLLAERMYNEGIRRGLGVELKVFCFVAGSPSCYVWIPEDSTAAEYRMLSGLKLCIVEQNRQVIVPIRNRIQWTWLNWFGFDGLRRSWTDDIPRRNTAFNNQVKSPAGQLKRGQVQ